jgi:glycosyltransferase involved in cell wall biosynthesis
MDFKRKQMNKLVSILIPVYNRETLIEETVQSALKQSYPDIEIIVVDNKSTDKTWEVLQKLASQDTRIKIFQNETNIGPVRNWKRCIDEASGEYGKILWSDDLISPEFVERTIPYLEDVQIGFVFTGIEVFDQNSRKDAYIIAKSGVYDRDKYIKGLIVDNNYPVSASCALFRLDDLKKNLLIEIPNKINSDFAMHGIGADALIFLLTANKYKKFAFIDEKLSFFRAHEDSISISSHHCKLTILYDIAKAHFVEFHLNNVEMKKKFNSLLVLHFLRCRNNRQALKNFSEFYINKNIGIMTINWIFLMKKILIGLIK